MLKKDFLKKALCRKAQNLLPSNFQQALQNMWSMFEESKFDGDLSKWDLSKVKLSFNMFARSPLEKKYGTNGEKLKLGITESYRRRSCRR